MTILSTLSGSFNWQRVRDSQWSHLHLYLRTYFPQFQFLDPQYPLKIVVFNFSSNFIKRRLIRLIISDITITNSYIHLGYRLWLTNATASDMEWSPFQL